MITHRMKQQKELLIVHALTVIYKCFTSGTDLPRVVRSLFFLPETGLIEARTEFLSQVIG